MYGILILRTLGKKKIFSFSITKFYTFIKLIVMSNLIQIGLEAPNFMSIGVYQNRLGKIRLSDYHEKKYVILFFHEFSFVQYKFCKAFAAYLNINFVFFGNLVKEFKHFLPWLHHIVFAMVSLSYWLKI